MAISIAVGQIVRMIDPVRRRWHTAQVVSFTFATGSDDPATVTLSSQIPGYQGTLQATLRPHSGRYVVVPEDDYVGLYMLAIEQPADQTLALSKDWTPLPPPVCEEDVIQANWFYPN